MAISAQKRLKVGDVLEVETPQGLAYIQYVGLHSRYGDLIRVLPGLYEKRPAEFAPLVSQAGYMTFYPARASVRQRFNEIVGFSPLPPEGAMPKVVRRERPNPCNLDETIGWTLVDSDGRETKRKRSELTEAEKKLPIVAIWDHQVLIDRICSGWTPEQEV
jgi:hypothetical protein